MVGYVPPGADPVHGRCGSSYRGVTEGDAMIDVEKLTNPEVQALVRAINAGDRLAFSEALTTDATMSDDGTERDLMPWAEREIFASHGHMDVESESDDGLSLVARYRNDTWGEMRTSWRFTVSGGLISHFDTGQA